MKQIYLDEATFERIKDAVSGYERNHNHWSTYGPHDYWKVYAVLADIAHAYLNGKDVNRFTFDDIYDMALDRGYGDPRLTAKDNARWEIECRIQDEQGRDINECECPEDEIFDYLEDHELYFDEDGYITE